MVLIISMDDDIVMSHFLVFRENMTNFAKQCFFPQRGKNTRIHLRKTLRVQSLCSCLCLLKNGLGKIAMFCRFYILRFNTI